jgi:hypothetical protein
MTLQRAAMFTTIATALQALIYFARYVVPLSSMPGAPPVAISLLIPSAFLLLTLWPVFFFNVFREYSGVAVRMPVRRLAILLAAVLIVNYVTARGISTVVYLSRFAELRASIVSAASLLLWLAFLVGFALEPQKPRTRTSAIALAALLCLTGLRQSFLARHLFASGIWPFLVQIVPTLVWMSEVLFMWLFWKTQPFTEHSRPD